MKIAGFDSETTGIAYGDHRIIEVAALVYDLASERLIRRFVERINPQRSIDAGAQKVHGISLSDLTHCRTWDKVGPELHRELSQADMIVAHNGDGFDFPFLNYEFKRIGLPALTVPTFDTMLEGRFATPYGAVPNLGALCVALDVPYDPSKAHAADYDVEVMMECFFRARRWNALPALSEGFRHEDVPYAVAA